jgi:two-component system chemotaxis response regulator CheY
MKVLAVDDSKTILDLIRETLTLHKYEVETADNGAQALDKYAKFRPDIVTLDLAMPVLDGYETLKRILHLDKNANVVLVTASEQQDILERCMEKGAIGYIVKPFTAKELVTAITNAWKAGSNKNVTQLFLLAAGKIEGSIKKMMVPKAVVSVVLKEIQVMSKQKPTQIISTGVDLSQIRVVPEVLEELKIEVPNGAVGYITEFGGQQRGAIISFIGSQDIQFLFGANSYKTAAEEQATEFFNIVNAKILSELANATHLVLSREPAKMLTRPGQQENNIQSLGDELTKATFEVSIDYKRILLEIQLWFSTGQIFRGRL